MIQIVYSNIKKCVGCNRCVRNCPSEMANVTYQDDLKNIKVRIENDYCIGCGACIDACKHNARYYTDDTVRFFTDLAAGKKISVITAPALKISFPHWKRLLRLLRNMGVGKIYDVSFGADISIWAYLRHMETNQETPIIAQQCPAIVSYAERLKPELLHHLSPVQSPMACLAIYLQKYRREDTPIATISSCIANKQETEALDSVQYSLTFEKLLRYLSEHGISFPEEDSGFDGAEAGLGSLLAVPGGLMENIRFFADDQPRIDVHDGLDVYKALDKYAESPKQFLPDIFDVLNCDGGCAVGTGGINGQSAFEVNALIQQIRKKETGKSASARHLKMLAEYDETLDLHDFMRSYQAIDLPMPEITDDDVQESFRRLHKYDYTDRHFNCGACGSDDCTAMARKIALGVNIPANCIVMSRDEGTKEHTRTMRYLSAVRNIAKNLKSFSDKDDYGETVIQAVRTIYEGIDGVFATALWRYAPEPNLGVIGGRLERIYAEFGDSNAAQNGIRGEWPDDWILTLKRGESVLIYKDQMKPEHRMLFPNRIETILLAPIIVSDTFWGFVTMFNLMKIEITEEEISAITVCGLLIVSSIIEHSLSQNLRKAQEEAISANAAKSQFLFSMSHEMRTPLNAVIGMTNIARSAQDEEQLNHCFDIINRSSKQLLSLINNVLDISKIEAGKVVLEHEQFDMRKMLRNVEGVASALVRGKRQELRFKIDPKLNRYYIGDALKLSQIITNLTSNAIKFTPEGGKITLALQKVQSDPKHSDNTERLRFEVTDNGIGVTEEQISRLFGSFEQADASITRQFGGAGLGLSISKGLVEKMGGTIGGTSAPGEGSTFFFEVDLELPEDDQDGLSGGRASSKASGLAEMHVLIVEDMIINREIFIALLEDTGIQIDEAENGKEALAMYRADPKKYDVIVMDIQMPVMDGYTATREIRKSDLPGSKTIPIIAMTANASQEDIDRGQEAGMNAHLSKPIDLKALIGTLEQFSGKK